MGRRGWRYRDLGFTSFRFNGVWRFFRDRVVIAKLDGRERPRYQSHHNLSDLGLKSWLSLMISWSVDWWGNTKEGEVLKIKNRPDLHNVFCSVAFCRISVMGSPLLSKWAQRLNKTQSVKMESLKRRRPFFRRFHQTRS